MLKVLLVFVAAVVALAAGLQSQARLTFPKYDELPEYHWVGDFEDPAECEDSLNYLKARVPTMGARCAYAPRYRVWWLMAKNIALVQAPNIVAAFR